MAVDQEARAYRQSTHTIMLLLHSVQLTLPSLLGCLLFCAVGGIRFNIVTTSARRFEICVVAV